MSKKIENYELALNTTVLSTQGIFNITEVNILEKSQTSKLPKLVKPNTSFSTLKPSMTAITLDETRPKSSWNNFLKSDI